MNLLKTVRWLLHGDEGWPHREGRPCALPSVIPTGYAYPDPPRAPRLGILPGEALWLAQRQATLAEQVLLAQRPRESPQGLERYRNATRGPT